MLTIQLDNNLMSSDIIKAIKAILKTQPKNYYSISNSLVDEVSELERDYKKGKIIKNTDVHTHMLRGTFATRCGVRY